MKIQSTVHTACNKPPVVSVMAVLTGGQIFFRPFQAAVVSC